MSQNDLVIANQSFPSFRTDLNSALQAINTTHSGTSLPSGAVAGTIWLDTTSATSPTLKIYDGTDSISLAIIDYTNNTVNWLDSSLSYNSTATSAGTLVLTVSSSYKQYFTGTTTHTVTLPVASTLTVGQTFEIHNNSTGSITVNSSGANLVGTVEANVTAQCTCILASGTTAASWDFDVTGFTSALSTTRGGTGLTSIGTSLQVLRTNSGATGLEFATIGGTTTPFTVTGDNVSGASIRLPEDTDNGSNYVALKAADNLTANLTLTLPSADGTSGQVLQTNGSGVLSFSSPSAGSFVFLGETSASNVASVSLNGYFTSDYDVYKIFIDGIYGSVSSYIAMTFNTTGAYTEQTSNYFFYMGPYIDTTNTAYAQFDSRYASYTWVAFNYAENTQAKAGVAELTIYNPLSTTYHKYVTGNATGYTATAAGFAGFFGGWRDATAITGIKFKMPSGNLYARKIKLYGVKNS